MNEPNKKMAKVNRTPAPTLNNLFYLSIPGPDQKYEFFRKIQDDSPTGFRSAGIVDFTPSVPLITLHHYPINLISDLYTVLIHFYKVHKGNYARPMMKLKHPDFIGLKYLFHFSTWHKKEMINGRLVDSGVKDSMIRIEFKTNQITNYQRMVEQSCWCIASNTPEPSLNINGPGIPFNVTKQLVDALRTNVLYKNKSD